VAVVVAVGLVSAPATAVGSPDGPASSSHGAAVYLVSHGWHVGLVVPRDAVPPGAWPEADDLPRSRYLEVGWGDGDYYPARRGTIALAFRAAFRSRWSVLQVVAFDADVARAFPGAKILAVDLSPHGFAALVRYIHEAYIHDAGGRPVRVAPAAYGVGAFYLARGHYDLRHNSNTWAAAALRVAGCPIDPSEAVTAGALLHQAAVFARVVRSGVLLRGGRQRPDMACA
jgi:uncharacterized protein (TIGR02117 family)